MPVRSVRSWYCSCGLWLCSLGLLERSWSCSQLSCSPRVFRLRARSSLSPRVRVSALGSRCVPGHPPLVALRELVYSCRDGISAGRAEQFDFCTLHPEFGPRPARAFHTHISRMVPFFLLLLRNQHTSACGIVSVCVGLPVAAVRVSLQRDLSGRRPTRVAASVAARVILTFERENDIAQLERRLME